MGNELSINGSLAGAFLAGVNQVEISALNKKIKFSKNGSYISGEFPLNILARRVGKTIKLKGIVYLISNRDQFANKLYLKRLANRYKVPASGIIQYRKGKIKPLIYVHDIDSLVQENACGSGSLAYSIYSGYTNIIQPSGQAISIKRNKQFFTIKAPAKIVE